MDCFALARNDGKIRIYRHCEALKKPRQSTKIIADYSNENNNLIINIEGFIFAISYITFLQKKAFIVQY